MISWVSAAALATGLALAPPVLGSDVGFLYGRVKTVDGNTYEGQLRWGKEEAFWDDIFNASKIKNDYIQFVDDHVRDRLRQGDRHGWRFLFDFDDDGDNLNHVFAVRFGDLKRIRVLRRDELVVQFRNGEELKLKGGSNDVGARVTVLDPKLGLQEVAWNRIHEVEFRDTPARLKQTIGEPLYGTVRTSRFEFTGHIQWDNDECLTIDKLDGDSEDGRVHIAFGDIAAIRKHRRGAMVTLKSGSELYVTGSNDVNSANRGVVVKIPDLGSVKIGWDDFEDVTFRHPAPNSGRSYAEYGAGRKLSGEVESRGGRYTGDIVYDLDEAWDFELLQGRNGDTEYLIPFREIVQIVPEGRYRATIKLRSGLAIELEDSQDVSRLNDGLLVFTNGKKPAYVAWPDVQGVSFVK